MKILLAVDGSDCGKLAVEAVAARPWPPDSEVKVLSAIEIPFTPTPETWSLPDSYYAQLEKNARASATQAVEQAADRVLQNKDAQLRISAETPLGRARDVIIDTAEKWGADLIILGSHGYSGWQRFLLGSVSHAVVAHAPCSVEIVRQRGAGKK